MDTRPGDKFRREWLPLVRKALDECFERNPVEFLGEDEFKDTSMMAQKFQEAVSRADKTKPLRIFLEQVYTTLQLSFTNSTCQTIMNCLIYKELKSSCEAENNPEQELSELVRSLAKIIQETSEDETRLKMPTIMPLTKFLKLERRRLKDRTEKHLTPCYVVIKKISQNLQDKDENEKSAEENVKEIPVITNAESQNHVVKFSEGFVVNPKKRVLSEDRSSFHCGIEPLKTENNWDEEKLYWECMNLKTKVILPKSEDAFGCKNFDENVKLKKRKTSSASSSSDLDKLYDFFEISEGKVKLKPGFECRDGYIVPKFVPSSHSSYRSSDYSLNAYRYSVPTPWLNDFPAEKNNFPVQPNDDKDDDNKDDIKLKNVFASINLKPSPALGTTSLQPAIAQELEKAISSFTVQNSPSSKSAQPVQMVLMNDISALRDAQVKLEMKEEDKPVSEPKVLVADDSDEIKIAQVKNSENPPSVRSLSCVLCQLECNSVLKLEEHQNSNHKNATTYPCLVCAKRFLKIPYLELHKKLKHDKNFSCEYCNVTLKDTEELEAHLLSKKHELFRGYNFFVDDN